MRADWNYICGLCSKPIIEGDPMFVITIEKVKRDRRRCSACAESTGESTPDLPPYMRVGERGKQGKPLTPYRPRFSLEKITDEPEWMPYREAE